MAFIDSTFQGGAMGGINPGAPTGGGVNANVGATVNAAPGTSGFGSSLQVHHWVLIFFAFDIAVLVATGILFNGKGRK